MSPVSIGVGFGITRGPGFAVVLGGVGGIVVGVIGGVFVLTGVINVCLLGPLFSVDLRGRPKTS